MRSSQYRYRYPFRSSIFALILLIFPWPRPAHALQLASPLGLETAETLPAHVGDPRFIDVNTWMDQTYDGTGQLQPLGYQLNQPITFQQMMVTQSPAKQAEIQGLMAGDSTGGKSYGLSDSPGSTTGQVNTYANIFVPVLAYGITDRFTLAVAVPIVHIDVSVASGFSANAAGNALLARAVKATSPNAATTARDQMNDAINQKLAWAGMDPLQSFQVNNIGDIQVVGKYRVYEDQLNRLAIKGTLSLPTGTAPDPDEAVDVPTGAGTYGAGAMVIHDLKLPWDFRWNSYGSYLGYLPHMQDERIPTEVNDPISPDAEDLHQNLQSLIQLGTGVERAFSNSGFSASAGYSLEYLSGASYDPGMYSAQQYGWLEGLQPSETLHSFLASVQFSTVEMYQAKKFFYPMQARLAESVPFAGRNATTNDLTTAELVLFF